MNYLLKFVLLLELNTRCLVERNHRTLYKYFRAFLSDDKQDWDEYVKYYVHCYNTTPIFGNKCSNCSGMNLGQIEPVYNLNNYSKELKFKLQLAHSKARICIDKHTISNKSQYDKKNNPIDLKLGDNVLVIDETRHKFDPIYKGPFIVTHIDSYNVKLLDLKSKKHFVVHKNRVSKY